ncbi:hypothetical protein F8388_015964 [Cannabis sativa]|uniref:Uncharacterized protein n=1 Tax=Cannabis sativa TaxID=3483 RepID=A0A7J6EY45_CANSA|nr:hypothetical protein F8388_015964 [Cannabis sativa]KAF4363246.1 hypothetical protein G4B88_016000 [Cannabis sativa]
MEEEEEKMFASPFGTEVRDQYPYPCEAKVQTTTSCSFPNDRDTMGVARGVRGGTETPATIARQRQIDIQDELTARGRRHCSRLSWSSTTERLAQMMVGSSAGVIRLQWSRKLRIRIDSDSKMDGFQLVREGD